MKNLHRNPLNSEALESCFHVETSSNISRSFPGIKRPRVWI